MKRHKWEGKDYCQKCGLVRRSRPLTKNLRHYGVGNFLYDYLINGEWIPKCPECTNKQQP